ncbi:MAG: hypothetical protein AB1689_05635 [Thermodesulfobacteriota bacterium]
MSRIHAWLVAACIAAYPALVGYGGPNPFHVAPFRRAGDNYAPGEWVESTTLSSKDAVTIVVMASWCPHCARMIDQLAANPSARGKVDMILFFDDENAAGMREGKHLRQPAKLAGRDLPYYFAKKREFQGLYSGFPTILSCSREGCTRLGRRDVGLQ